MKYDASIIISTYNQPDWLYKVLLGYAQQTHQNFEIIVADDGSKMDTYQIIQNFKKQTSYAIKHIWQEDEGFQKNRILNKAIRASKSPYLIFTDGDCIPRKDFVEKHLTLRKPKAFLSGGYFKLPKMISEKISKEDISNQYCFDKFWLIKQGLKKNFKLNKLTSRGLKENLLNQWTPTKATWDGMNASGWKKDILAVNGFDERMKYGGEDRELGERLMNLGIKPIQARYSLICVHLHHERGYKNTVDFDRNKQIRKETKSKKKTWTDYGINQS